MNRSKLTWIAALGLVLAACGGDNKDDEGATTSEGSAGKQTAAKAAQADDSKADEQPSSGTTGPGSWKRIGKADEYKQIIGGVVQGGALYHAVRDGTLYKTDLATGKLETISRKPDFGGIRWLLTTGDQMLSIERNGTVYTIGTDASREPAGKAGAYKDSIAAAAVPGKLFTIEKDGTFYITDLTTMGWTSLKKSDYGNTRYMLASGDKVVTVEKDGSAFRIDTSSPKGSWANLGDNELWKGTRAAAFHGGELYRIGADGALYRVAWPKGDNTALGKPDFQHVVWMGSDGSSLITLEKDGSLYRVATE
jgi:hypothetical protein